MNIAKAQQLRDFVAGIPEKDFRIDTWQCGSQACALGWAITRPEFQVDRWPNDDPLMMHNWGFEYGADLLDIPLVESKALFSAQGDDMDWDWDDDYPGDKTIFLNRLDKMLERAIET